MNKVYEIVTDRLIEEENNNLTLGSLFDGSGGFPLGGYLAGIKPVWASEVEPFPIRVTTKRLPQITHYGDVSKLSGAEVPPVDIITFGSPCQDMSVAGKRRGLDGERSSLFYQAVRIVKEMREKTNGEKPRYIIWENVPGAFSSNKGEDFRCVLEEICKIKDEHISVPQSGKWTNAGEIVGEQFSLAWRVLDAQYWGVPQRRKRIFLVADFAGQCAGKILFESEGVSGYSAESFRAWQGAASPSCRGAQKAGGTDAGIGTGAFLYKQGAASRSVGFEEEKSPTLSTDANHVGVVCLNDQGGERMDVSKAYGICSKDSNSMKSDNPKSGFYEADTSRCIDANGGNPACNQGGIAIVEGNGSRPSHHGNGYAESDVMYTLNTVNRHAVCKADAKTFARQRSDEQIESEKSATLTSTYHDAGGGGTEALIVDDAPTYTVRRLTPVECARLQGFPDWWCDEIAIENPSYGDIDFWREVFETHRNVMGNQTKPKTEKQIIKWLKNPYSDSAAYKMWGNGVALPNVVFVLSGIVYYSQLPDFLL